MWSQSWGNVYELLEPYPGQGRESLTDEMKAQVSCVQPGNYDIQRILIKVHVSTTN